MKKILMISACICIFSLFNNAVTGYAGQEGKTAVQGVKFVDDKSADKKLSPDTADNEHKKKKNKSKPMEDKQPGMYEFAGKKEKNIAEFKAYVDKSLITIGDKVKYTMEIDADRSVEIGFPSYASNLGGFAVRDFGKDKPVKSGKNRVKIRQWYIMDTFTTGSYVIPSQFARVKTSSGQTHTLKSPEIFVEVKSVIGDDKKEQGLRDIKFPLYIPFSIPPAAIIAGVIIIAAGLAVWIFYRRRKSKVELEPPLPAYELALLELEKIENMNLIEKGLVKDYYYMVSDVLRKYLEGRFSLRAPEQTTEEFLDNVTRSDTLENRYIELLKEYLMHCDMVKYAKLEPDKGECSKLIETTRKFVEETKPVEEDYIADYEAVK